MRVASIEINVLAHAYTLASIVSLFICMYNVDMHTYVVINPLPGGEISRVVFIWDELAETWRHFEGSRISRYGEFQEMKYIYQDIWSMCCYYYVCFI